MHECDLLCIIYTVHTIFNCRKTTLKKIKSSLLHLNVSILWLIGTFLTGTCMLLFFHCKKVAADLQPPKYLTYLGQYSSFYRKWSFSLSVTLNLGNPFWNPNLLLLHGRQVSLCACIDDTSLRSLSNYHSVATWTFNTYSFKEIWVNLLYKIMVGMVQKSSV